jgi:crossover junction endodeoxyribonuclease RuvC
MIVIGIDPGTALTGYGIIEESETGQLTAIRYGAIETSADLTLDKRLQNIYHSLSQLLVLHRPETGAVEKLFFQRNVRTAMSVGQARGVLLLALAEAGVKVAEYTPMEVKQAVSGYGGADKNQVQQMVRTILSLDAIPQPDDVADALAIAICHINSHRWEKIVQDNKG